MAYHEYEEDGKLVRRHYNGKRFEREALTTTITETAVARQDEEYHLRAVKVLNDLQDYLGDALFEKWCAANIEPLEEKYLYPWSWIYWDTKKALQNKEQVKEKLDAT